MGQREIRWILFSWVLSKGGQGIKGEGGKDAIYVYIYNTIKVLTNHAIESTGTLIAASLHRFPSKANPGRASIHERGEREKKYKRPERAISTHLAL